MNPDTPLPSGVTPEELGRAAVILKLHNKLMVELANTNEADAMCALLGLYVTLAVSLPGRGMEAVQALEQARVTVQKLIAGDPAVGAHVH